MKSSGARHFRKPETGVRFPAEASGLPPGSLGELSRGRSEEVGIRPDSATTESTPKRNARSAPSRKNIRAEVFRRARGNCEACGAWVGEDGEQGHLDHFFGRAKVQESASNCWGLCVACDDSKTNNRPAASYWLARFAVHATRYGYLTEAQLADTKLETLRAKGLVAR